jgi:hypothetical protein
LFYIFFFIFHYSVFLFGQLVFIILLIGNNNIFIHFTGFWSEIQEPVHHSIGPVIGAIILSHLFSFIFDFILNREYENTSMEKLLIQPYKRIFVQQFVIIFGGIIFLYFNIRAIFIVILVALKIYLDLKANQRERIQHQDKLKAEY